MFNLFSGILDKAKSGANYLSSGQLGSDIFDATYRGGDATQTLPYKAVNKIAGGISKTTGMGMEDKTQSLIFKGVQGGANLYTGAKEGLLGIEQNQKQSFDAEMSQKRQQFISDMLAQGRKKEDIFSALDSLQAKGEFDYKPGYGSRLATGLGTRLGEVQRTTERLADTPIVKRMATGIPSYAGDVVGTVFEPVGAALSPVVQKVIEKTGQTENVQEIGQWWEGIRQSNPNFADAIEGSLNVASLAPLPLAKPVGQAIEKGAKAGGKATVRGAEVVAPKVAKGIKTGVSKSTEGLGTVSKSLISQQSGLGTPAIESFLRKPELQGQIRSGKLSAARTLEEAKGGIDQVYRDLSETGKQYDIVRKSNVAIPKTEAKQVLLSQLESDGLVTGGKLNLVDLPVKDRGAITQALKYIDEYGDTMTPQNALSIRQKLDDLINYKSDVGGNGQRIVKGLRAKYDDFLATKLPGLKDVDAQYAPERQFWSQVRGDIYKADGTLKDNALSVISNITNKGNEARLARMEKILPGIGEKVKALKAFDDVQNASGIKVGTYTRAATTGGLALVNPAVAIATWVATHPVVVARVLESIGLATQKIKSILSKGKKITPDEVKVVQEAITKVPKSEVEKIINNLSFDPKANKLTSRTIVGPTTINTSGKKIIKKAPESPVALERGYTTSVKRPIVKRSADVDSGMIQEAKKYKTLQEYMESKQSLHRPPDITNGSRLDDMTMSYGDDIYSPDALRYYGDTRYAPDRKALSIIKQARGNPDMEVTIYRAIENGDRETFRPGDWVSLTKEYVKEHGEGPLKGNYKIIEQKVKAKDIVGNADSLQEYGYRPNGHKDYTKEELRKIYEQAHK